MTTQEQITIAWATYNEENTKFVEKGNKAAGTRARNALNDLKKLALVRRKEITEEKKVL